MHIILKPDRLEIHPDEKSGSEYDILGTTFIEQILGLKKAGDHVMLVRENRVGTDSLLCIYTKPVKEVK